LRKRERERKEKGREIEKKNGREGEKGKDFE